jgi:multicomponent Na+:H+ antiporter subunit E
LKKTTFPAFLSTALLIYCFWLLITGQIVAIFQGRASWEVLVAGALVSGFVSLFTARFFIHRNAFYLLAPKRFFSLLAYVFVFLWELTKANVDVAFRALNPKLPVNPGIVKVPADVKAEYGLSMLANSITLTPGTITMDIADENGKTNYYIHWINVKETDPAKAGDAIKGTMEKWIRRIWD